MARTNLRVEEIRAPATTTPSNVRMRSAPRRRRQERSFDPGTLELTFTFYKNVAGAIEFRPSNNVSFSKYNRDIAKELNIVESEFHSPYVPNIRRQYHKEINHTTLILYHYGDSRADSATPVVLSVRFEKAESREWRKSELSEFLSDDFMSSLIAGHFHFVFAGTPKIKIAYDEFEIPADFHEQRHSKPEDRTIAPLECTIFRNGYISLVLRLRNLTKITQSRVLELTKRPDQLVKPIDRINQLTQIPDELLNELCCLSITAKSSDGKDAGILNVLAFYIVQIFDNIFKTTLEYMDLEYLKCEPNWTTGKPDWTIYLPMVDEAKPWHNWSRPYVGVSFRIDGNEIVADAAKERLRRFIIACGRTTPEFFPTGFEDPKDYLDSNNRNVYGDGGSIVFVASRGWCVWNAGNQMIPMFRFAVVEMTHFLIMALEASLRARRRFHFDMKAGGSEIIRTLDIAIANLGRISGGRAVRREIRRATVFLGNAYVRAPFDDGATILAAHLKTHTARAANLRYRALKSLDETDKAAQSVMEQYVSALEISTSYIHSYAARLSRANVWLGMMILAVTGLSVAVEVAIRYHFITFDIARSLPDIYSIWHRLFSRS